MKASLVIIAVTLSTPASAQWLNQPTAGLPRTPDGKPDLSAPAPRAPDGKPDLSGLWTKISPKYSRNIAADLKRDEVQPWARALVEERRENLKAGLRVAMPRMLALIEPAAQSNQPLRRDRRR